MLRRLALTLGSLLAVLLLLIATVNLIAEPASQLPGPSPTLVISAPGGRRFTLGELLASPADSLPAPAADTPPAPAALIEPDPPEPGPASPEAASGQDALPEELAEALDALLSGREAEWIAKRRADELARGDLYALAEYNLALGHTEEALGLFRSVPAAHPNYGRAQRRIGWDLFSRGLDQPARGVPFVHASLRENPWDGNAWQDAARVYGATLGLPFID
jgi:hypothetical protein